MSSLKAQRAADQAAALDKLREHFPAGSRVGVIIRSVSSSGMSRQMSVLAVGEHYDGKAEVVNVSHLVARAGLFPLSRGRHDAVTVKGAGMDMAFHLVYTMARAMYDDAPGEPGRSGYQLSHYTV